jgi:glycosyltransferase involved in cell wall biosynthesis
MVGVALTKVAKIPLLYHAHNLMGDELETYFERPRARAFARKAGLLLDARVPRLADGMVSVSLATTRRLRQLAGNVELIEYQPPAVDYGARPECVPANTNPLIYCGNLDGYQGIDVMMKALSRLGAQGRCVFATQDAEKCAGLLTDYALDGLVVVHGSFDEVKAHLGAAQIGLLPRTVDSGFPIKLINYLAAGLPVVACRGGAQGLDEDAGVVLVDDGDDEAMARAIRRLLDDDDLRHRLSERATTAFAAFSWPAHVRSLDNIYARLLDRRQGMGASKETQEDVC